MPKLKRFKKAASGQGTIFSREITRKDGSTYIRWEGNVSHGVDGQGKRKRSTVYGASQAEVIAKIDEIKRKVSSGSYNTTTLTVAEYLEQWLNHLNGKIKPRTLEDYRYTVSRYISNEPRDNDKGEKVPSTFGKIKLSKLTALHIQKLIDSVHEAVSADRANKVRRALHTALDQAYKWSLVSDSLVDKTEPFRHERKTMQIWSTEDTAKFLAYARTNRLYAMFYLAIVAGLRSGELRALQWSDLKGKTLHVQRSLARLKGELILSTPKTEKGKRRVSLNDATLEVLSLHRKQQEAERASLGTAFTDLGLIFCKQDGTYITTSNLEGIWHRLLASSEVPKIRVHDMRHLNVSLRRRLGQDAKLIADQVGHSDPTFTTRVYTHLFADDVENAAVDLSAVIPSINPETAN
jgi:integrase